MPILAGTGALSARAFGFTSEDYFGQVAYTTAGTYSFIVPFGVTSVAMVAVGGGAGGAQVIRFLDNTNPSSRIYINSSQFDAGHTKGGGGGSLSYINSVSVTPGETLTVVVGSGGSGGILSTSGTGGYGGNGGTSYVARGASTLVSAGGGNGTTGAGGSVIVGTGYSGGSGGLNFEEENNIGFTGGGGGAAGGYSGNGGSGGGGSGSSGSGGAGGGGASGNLCTVNDTPGQAVYKLYSGGGGGGGVELLGQGSSGSGATAVGDTTVSSLGARVPAPGGGGGSSGSSGSSANGGSFAVGGVGGGYGGGGGGGGSRNVFFTNTSTYTYQGYSGAAGSNGAVRIMWSTNPAVTRAFPSTNTGNL
jgi:hypothetical protein